MVKPFEITTATGDIPLDSAGHGTAVFTVTNTTQHSIKAIAKVAVQPDNSPAAGWIKIVPRDEIGLPAPTDMRLLSAGLIDDYKLQIDVPVDAASGRYSFNLIVGDAREPGEYYTKGPGVSFMVPSRSLPPPPPNSHWVKVALSVVGIAIVVGAVIAFSLRPPPRYPHLGRWELVGGFDDHPCGRATLVISEAGDGRLNLVYYGLCSGESPNNFQPMEPFSVMIQSIPLPSRRLAGLVNSTLITVEPAENDLLLATVYGDFGRLAQRIFRRADNDEVDLPTPGVVATMPPDFSLAQYVSMGHPALDFLLLTPDDR